MLKRLAMFDRKKLITIAQSYLLLTVGAGLLAINFNIFMAPSQIAPGGIGGVALLFVKLTGWSAGTILLGLQGVMIFVGFWYLGRIQFVIRALYVSLIYGFGVDLLQSWLPAQGITDDLLLNGIFGGLIGGIGAGLIFRGRSSVAGTSVISRIVQLKTGMPISQLYIFIDGGIILLQAMAFGWDKALYGVIMLFIYGLAADYVQEGPSVVRTTFIVTNEPDLVAKTLFEQLRVGVTAWPGTGMFTHRQRTILFCTVSRAEIGTLKQIVTQSDPTAFVTVGHGHQAIGGVVRRPEPARKPTSVRKPPSEALQQHTPA